MSQLKNNSFITSYWFLEFVFELLLFINFRDYIIYPLINLIFYPPKDIGLGDNYFFMFFSKWTKNPKNKKEI